jgi:glycosyltransferase involved in cell wall biosynthesis
VKVLWVSPDLPHPERGAGAVLELELLRAAAERHDVHLITADHSQHHRRGPIVDLGVSVEFVHWRPRHVPTTTLGTVAAVATYRPTLTMGVRSRRLPALVRAVEGWQATHPVDLVHVMQGELAPVLQAVRGPATLLLFDVLSRQMAREVELHTSRQKRVRWGAELRKATAWERRWYPRADGIACVSAVDAEALASLIGRPVRVLPNPIADAFFESPDRPRSDRIVTLVSSLAYRPNIDALTWLGTEIWPLVLEQVPDARLHVVGSSPEPAAVDAARTAGARLFADVPDVRPHYWEAAVSVAPVRLGSGLRNKVIHAMACGAPVVATSTALEGIDAVPGRHLLVADDAAGFAAAIVDALLDPAAAAQRAHDARAIADGFRSHVAAAALEDWWSVATA